MTTNTINLTLDNFTTETGFRFRVSKNQAARIAISALDNDALQNLSGMNVTEAATSMANSCNASGKPYNWVEEAIALSGDWNDSMSLTREAAFQEFLADGGLERLQNRNPEIPDSVYLDPTLTIDNFTAKVEAVIGVKRRFRVSRDQKARLKDGSLTREQALAEVVASKQPNPIPTSTTEVLEGIEITGS